MTTAKAIIGGAVILALGIVAAAYTYHASAPRYTMTNIGGGQALRLDARSGEVLGCRQSGACLPAIGPGSDKDEWSEFQDAPANASR